MGIDLKLLPAQRSAAPNANHYYSDTILPLTRCSHDLWGLLLELPYEPLDTFLYTPLGSGKIEENDERLDGLDDEEMEDLEDGELPQDLRRLNEDVFGPPLHSVAASDLVALRSHDDVQSSGKNRAAWAYLAELPPDFRVVLYWC